MRLGIVTWLMRRVGRIRGWAESATGMLYVANDRVNGMSFYVVQGGGDSQTTGGNL